MAEKLAEVAIIGSGGAEASLALKYSQSPHVGKIHVIPGNQMIQELCEKPVEIYPDANIEDGIKTAVLCKDIGADLVDIRNERAIAAYLANNLRDLFKIPVVGPNSDESRLESDKEYARIIGNYIGLPQPKYSTISFKDLPFGKKFPDYYDEVLAKHAEGRFFVKATGFFDGKGVIETHSRNEIEEAIEWLRAKDPKAAEKILIEHPLEGEEASVIANLDGHANFKVLGYAQDHKKAFDGDLGPNTGGMGAVSHPLIAESMTFRQGAEDIISRIAKHIKNYRGTLYPGLMATETVIGLYPSVVEINCRWGDPEAQAIISGLNVDFFELGMETAKGTLRRVKISDDGQVRVVVAVATKEEFDLESKIEIKSISELKKLPNIDLFPARVVVEDKKYWIGGPGRVFHVGAAGKDVIEAREKLEVALEMVRGMDGKFLYHRTDIGKQDVARLQNRV